MDFFISIHWYQLEQTLLFNIKNIRSSRGAMDYLFWKVNQILLWRSCRSKSIQSLAHICFHNNISYEYRFVQNRVPRMLVVNTAWNISNYRSSLLKIKYYRFSEVDERTSSNAFLGAWVKILTGLSQYVIYVTCLFCQYKFLPQKQTKSITATVVGNEWILL